MKVYSVVDREVHWLLANPMASAMLAVLKRLQRFMQAPLSNHGATAIAPGNATAAA